MDWKTTAKEINYTPNSQGYIWGTLHPDIVELAAQANIHGNWLNLAAGDGRYNELLIDSCESITALDLDQKALDRLAERLSLPQRNKVKLVAGDITTPLPFGDHQFDGCLSTGTLHFLKPDVLRTVFGEIFRVLRPQASLIMDFAVDIERECPDGSRYVIEDEPQFTLDEGKNLLADIFQNAQYDLRVGTVPDFPVNNFDLTYIFRCNVLSLLVVLP